MEVFPLKDPSPYWILQRVCRTKIDKPSKGYFLIVLSYAVVLVPLSIPTKKYIYKMVAKLSKL